MRLPKIILTAGLLLVLGFGASGQRSDDIRLLDEFDPRAGCETLERGIDALLMEASNDVQSTAYVLIRQGDNAFDNLLVYRKAVNYPRFRGFPAERFAVLLTQGSKDIKVELWIGRNGGAPQVNSSELAIRIPESVSRVQIFEDTIELVMIDGRETYIGTGNPFCLYWFYPPDLLGELLRANDEFSAEITIKVRSSKDFRKLEAILDSDFRNEGLPAERVKFVYGGRDKDLEGGRAKLASVTTSFVKKFRK